MAGISFHVASTAFGLATIGEILRPALDASGDLWSRLSAIGPALQDANYQKSVAIPAVAYVATRAARSSIEKSPIINLGKLRIYAL